MVGAFLVALGGIAAAIAGARGGGHEYREAVVVQRQPLSLDPLIGRDDPAVRDAGHLMYRSLLRLDSRALPVSDLVASWGVSGDGLTYRFTLLSGLRWSNAQPVSTRDVAATVAVVQSAGYADRALAAAFKGVVVTVHDRGTVALTLPAPRASFATSISDLPILPAAATAGRTPRQLEAGAQQPMQADGPYRAVRADASSVTLTANPRAARVPAIGTVTLTLVRSFDDGLQLLADGRVDGLAATAPRERAALAGLRGVRLDDSVTFRFVDLVLNERAPGLADPVVRHAVAAAIDRRAIVSGAVDGTARPQAGAIPAGISWASTRPVPQPSPTDAARALDAAGWQQGADGIRQHAGQRLAFDLVAPDAAPLPAVAHLVARQLAAIGIEATVRSVPEHGYASSILTPHLFDMAVADWDSGPDPDVSIYWRSTATPPAGFNVSGAAPDAFLDRALDGLATAADPRLRRDAAREVDARLAEDVPAVFLYAPEATLATSRDLGSVILPPVGGLEARYADIASWRPD